MIAIIDYGAGNLFSVQNALNYLGFSNQITKDKKEIQKADGLILPGVGAFPDAMKKLRDSDLLEVIRQEAERKPFLGICLGMQMLFEKSFEFSETEGLGFIPGEVRRIETTYKIPHMGWNHLRFYQKDSPLLQGIEEGSSVYFVHSYMAYTPRENISAVCDYGVEITALVEKGMIFGTQFHPEKSGEVGLQMLKNFGGLTR